ncbi:MAG: hypothetical protein V4628_03685 [Pseudomonadota bacterium]
MNAKLNDVKMNVIDVEEVAIAVLTSLVFAALPALTLFTSF